MKAVPIKAHQITSLGGARASDGQHGLIRFVRENAMPDGTKDVWVALPNNLLPYLATVAVMQLPQPQGNTVPHIIKPKGIALGGGPGGEIVLSLVLEKGATLSYMLTPEQASGLSNGLKQVVAEANGGAKGAAKPKAPAKAKPKPKKPAKPKA